MTKQHTISPCIRCLPNPDNAGKKCKNYEGSIEWNGDNFENPRYLAGGATDLKKKPDPNPFTVAPFPVGAKREVEISAENMRVSEFEKKIFHKQTN